MAVFDPDLLDAIEGLGASDLHRHVWRHTFGDYGPEQANTGGARWNPRGVDAIYASLERDTAIAEGTFRLELEPLRPRAKRTVYSLNVTLASVVDLREPGALAVVGVTHADLVDFGMRKTQLVGGAVEWLGHDGLLVPSARAPGDNLVIFPNQMEADGAITRAGAEVIFDPAGLG